MTPTPVTTGAGGVPGHPTGGAVGGAVTTGPGGVPVTTTGGAVTTGAGGVAASGTDQGRSEPIADLMGKLNLAGTANQIETVVRWATDRGITLK